MAFAIVKGNLTATQQTSPATVSMSGGNTNGNLIVLGVINRGGTSGITGVTDSEGNTYTNIANVNDHGGAITVLHSWWVAPVTGGSTATNTLSVAFNSNASEVLPVVTEVSGLLTTSPLDSSATLSSTNQGSTVSYAITAASAGELILTLNQRIAGGSFWSGLSGTDLFGTSNVVAEMNYFSSASGSNSITATANQTAFGTTTVALKLPTSFSISGNAGVASATVAWSGTASGSTTADSSGNYTISNLANGSYTITPSLTGFTFSPTSSNQTISGSNITNVNFAATSSFVLISKAFVGAALCDNSQSPAVAASSWNLPSSNFPVASCRSGTNIQEATLDFADGQSSQFGYLLPSDWTGAIDAKLIFFSAATSGTVIFQIATACDSTNGSATDDVAFNTADAFGTITLGSTANAQWQATKTSINTTGCSAGNTMHIKLSRSSSDTATSVARVKGLELTIRRSNS